MHPRKKDNWEVRVHGQQLNEIDVDLFAQIVVMLGRQMSLEASSDEDETTPDAGDSPSNH